MSGQSVLAKVTITSPKWPNPCQCKLADGQTKLSTSAAPRKTHRFAASDPTLLRRDGSVSFFSAIDQSISVSLNVFLGLALYYQILLCR
jgi:hypothetical protein